MRQPQPDAPETNVLIAPGEIQELLTRLTEQTVEAVPHNQSRTLEGLAAETGIPVLRLQAELARMRGRSRLSIPPAAVAASVLMAGYAFWLINHKAPEPAPATVATPAPAPAAPSPDLGGLSPLTSVTYGPDAGSEMVDTGYEPLHAVPEGLSFYALVGGVLWGAGDHRAAVIEKPLSAAEEQALRENLTELLKYVRTEATRRHLPLSPPFGVGEKHAYLVSLCSNCYYGSSGTSVQLPPASKADDTAAERAIKRAAKELVEQLQNSLRQRREWQRQDGP